MQSVRMGLDLASTMASVRIVWAMLASDDTYRPGLATQAG
jgi:hypothetical protein